MHIGSLTSSSKESDEDYGNDGNYYQRGMMAWEYQRGGNPVGEGVYSHSQCYGRGHNCQLEYHRFINILAEVAVVELAMLWE